MCVQYCVNCCFSMNEKESRDWAVESLNDSKDILTEVGMYMYNVMITIHMMACKFFYNAER